MQTLSGILVASLLLLSGQTGMIPVVDTKPAGSAPLNPCLVSAWPMNEGSGTTLHDTSTGGTNTATIAQAGAVTWQSNTGLPGTTPFWQSGASPRGAVATSTTLTNFTGTTPFSVSVWAAATTNAPAMLSTLDAVGGSQKGWELGWTLNGGAGTKLILFLTNTWPSNVIYVYGATGVANGTVGYFVATYDGSQTAAGVKLYANGSAISTTVGSNTLSASIANSIPVHFAERTDGSQAFGGAMAFAEVYNCVLTPTQISTYNSNGPGIY